VSGLQGLDDALAAGVKGRRVLLRADLNVPLSDGPGGSRVIADDGRIRAVLPTVERLVEAGAAVVLCSHLGRPHGHDSRASLAPVQERLAELLGQPVAFSEKPVGAEAERIVGELAPGEVAMVQNLRFDPRETSKDAAERLAFAKELAVLADLYVGDAFGAVHRRHASVDELPRLLPRYAGEVVTREVAELDRLTQHPEKPYVVVLGGSKVSDKLGVISALLPQVERVLVGGGMCFTFLAAQGHSVGASLLEEEMVATCRDLLDKAPGQILLPHDFVVATSVSADASTQVVAADAIPEGWAGVDIGPETVTEFAAAIAGARTVFWNGPMGVFELPPFAAGTRGVAEALAACPGHTVVGGGDSAAAVRLLGLPETAFDHISTGGGASLEYLEGRPLPGLAALEA
jgi:phosphoglycerate kinase